MGKSMNADESKRGDGRMAAGRSPDEEEESDSDGDGHQNQTRMPQTGVDSAGNPEVATSFSAAPIMSSLGQSSKLVPSSAVGFPPQAQYLPPIISQPASIAHLISTSQAHASPNTLLPYQLSSVSSIASLVGRLPHLHQAQAPAPPLNRHVPLPNQPSTVPVPPPSSLAGASNNIMSLIAEAQRSHIVAPWVNKLNSVPILSSLEVHPHVHQSQASDSSSSLNPSLLGQLGLASLAHNVAELLQIPQAQTQAQAVASLQPLFLNQLAAAQADQSSYLPPSRSVSDQTNTSFLLQGLSASQNPTIPSSGPSIPPHRQSRPQHQQLIEQLIQDNMRKDQLIASLLSQLQQQVQTTIPNNNHTSAQMQTATLANLLETIFPNNAANSASNLQGSHQGTSQTSAFTSSFQQQPPQNRSMSAPCHTISNHGSEQHTTEIPASDLASAGHIYGPKTSKEKRWMMRYKELKEFHQKHGHCRVPHGFAENRKLSWWVMNQRAQYQLMKQGKKNWLSDDRIALLNELGFDWTPIIGKSGDR